MEQYVNSNIDSIFNFVIGSWGSYNECNERALGSKWLNFKDFSSWDKIEEELKNEGFELNGIDEELFIQDVNGLDINNCDYRHPKNIFRILFESEVMIDKQKEKILLAYLEINSWDDFVNLVEEHGANWDCDIYLYENKDMEDIAYDILHECYQIPEYLENYIDYKAYARDLEYDGCYFEVSNGILEMR